MFCCVSTRLLFSTADGGSGCLVVEIFSSMCDCCFCGGADCGFGEAATVFFSVNGVCVCVCVCVYVCVCVCVLHLSQMFLSSTISPV